MGLKFGFLFSIRNHVPVAEAVATGLWRTNKHFKRYFSAALPVAAFREPAAGLRCSGRC